MSSTKSAYDVYFLKGTETKDNLPERGLQREMLSFIEASPLQNSFLIFRPDILQAQIDQI